MEMAGGLIFLGQALDCTCLREGSCCCSVSQMQSHGLAQVYRTKSHHVILTLPSQGKTPLGTCLQRGDLITQLLLKMAAMEKWPYYLDCTCPYCTL